MTHLKPDADKVRAVMASLTQAAWLADSERQTWPRFLFHHTDIRNAVEILQDGCLLSRQRAQERGRLQFSSGSREVLSHTGADVQDCVRLYFRPKTPTQYYAEGIQSRSTLTSSRFPDAHCPVPIFFLFDSVDILVRADSSFSGGNLGASGTQLLSSADELAKLEWPKIYHNSWIRPHERDIIHHRHAEVVVPGMLSLDALRFVMCRSHAEKETLIKLLPADCGGHYHRITIASQRMDPFFRRYTYVRNVHLDGDQATVNFSPDTKSPGPFAAKATIEHASIRLVWEDPAYMASGPLSLSYGRDLDQYAFRLELDGHPAYLGTYDSRSSRSGVFYSM